MFQSIHRAFLVAVALGLPFAACGGKTADVGSSGGSSGSSSGGSSSGSGSSGSSGGGSGSTSGGGSGSSSGGSSGGISGSSSGGVSSSSSGGVTSSSSGSSSGSTVSCVMVEPTSYDQSCKTDGDCFPIVTGTICTGNCLCGAGAAINQSGRAKYEATIAGVMPGLCPCPPQPPPRCLGNRCVVCTGGPADPPGCGITVGPDAGIACMSTGGGGSGSADGGACSFGEGETCSNGTTYYVKCSCPDATCYCSESSAQGGSSGGAVPFMGCPFGCGPKSVALAYAACGYPAP